MDPNRADLGVMAIKGYYTLPKEPELEPHHQMQFWLVGWVLWHINLYWLFNAKSIFMQVISSILSYLV